jgi:serine/threonine protein kinase
MLNRVSPPNAPPGEEGRFGKYILRQQLALGGMAHIFLASLDGPDGFSKACVIKRILPEYASLESFSRMFADEAKVAALLTHPNIVQVFDFGKIDGQYYLAMEWIQGASLDRVLRQMATLSSPLGPRVAVEVGIAIAAALSYAHDKTLPDGTHLRLVHRDITPGNVLISRDGIVKLADFGIVKSSVNHERTVVGVIKGKYAYMSPEQITNRELDHRSDLYSLGIVLYEASTGCRLFKRDTMEATVMAASHAEVPAPSTLLAGFPPDLEHILMRLLAKEPDARYQSAQDLLEELERFRMSQNWTSGGRELASVMAALFPSERGVSLTAIPAASVSTGASRTGSTGSPNRKTAAALPQVQERTLPAEELVDLGDLSEPPRDREPEGFPWGIAVAVGVAIAGSAVFWILVT